jgi:hypothetical protein
MAASMVPISAMPPPGFGRKRSMVIGPQHTWLAAIEGEVCSGHWAAALVSGNERFYRQISRRGVDESTETKKSLVESAFCAEHKIKNGPSRIRMWHLLNCEGQVGPRCLARCDEDHSHTKAPRL